MALKPKLSACILSGCTSMPISDVTGVYNANTNLTGYDSTDTVNPEKPGITSAILQVKAPSQTTFTSFTVTSAVTSSNEQAETFGLITIANTDVVTGSSYFESGRWEFIYTIVDSGNEYIKKYSKVFACRERCCVDQMYNDWLANWCGCGDCASEDEMKQIQYAENLLTALDNSDTCLTDSQIEEMLECIGRVCNSDDCCS
jgi:hypothetical protein